MTRLNAVKHAQQNVSKFPNDQVIVIYFQFGAILRDMAADIVTLRSLRKATVIHTRASFLTFRLTS